MDTEMEMMFLHCKKCVEELPAGTSPADFQRIEVGLLQDGRLCVWCTRHEIPVGIFTLANPEILQSKKCVRCERREPHTHN